MIHDILRLTRRGPLPIDLVCEKLGINAKQFAAAVAKASEVGAEVRVRDGFVSTKGFRIIRTEKAPVLGDKLPGRKRTALVTDIHFGSRHCQEEALVAFLQQAKREGVTTVAVTGDILDGNRPVLLDDQDFLGWESQAERAVKAFAVGAKGMQVVAIDGNHDGYFSSSAGMVSGKLLETRMREAGVDWRFAGVCIGRAVIHCALWELWHCAGGAGTRNGVRRMLNERIEGMAEPAHVLAMGHLHKFTTVAAYPENCFGVAGGTYQSKGGEFANRITRPWDIGGAIVSHTLRKDGTVGEFSAEFRGA